MTTTSSSPSQWLHVVAATSRRIHVCAQTDIRMDARRVATRASFTSTVTCLLLHAGTFYHPSCYSNLCMVVIDDIRWMYHYFSCVAVNRIHTVPIHMSSFYFNCLFSNWSGFLDRKKFILDWPLGFRKSRISSYTRRNWKNHVRHHMLVPIFLEYLQLCSWSFMLNQVSLFSIF